MIEHTTVNLEFAHGSLEDVPAEFYVEPYKDLITGRKEAEVTLKQIWLDDIPLGTNLTHSILSRQQVDRLEEHFAEEFLQN